MIPKAIVYFNFNGWTSGRYFRIKKDIMSISSMNSVINNNRKLLKNGKRVPFTKMNGGSGKKRNYKRYVLPEVFPHVLHRVRIKIRKENRRLFIRKVVVGFVTLLIMILYVMNLSK